MSLNQRILTSLRLKVFLTWHILSAIFPFKVICGGPRIHILRLSGLEKDLSEDFLRVELHLVLNLQLLHIKNGLLSTYMLWFAQVLFH